MKTFVLLSILSFCSLAMSQERDRGIQNHELTGNLRLDLSIGNLAPQDSGRFLSGADQRKSGLTAALLSAVVPGAGEYYAESYWKAGSFLGGEIVLWVIYATKSSAGDSETERFQNYADEHWSVVRYAQWMQTNYAILNAAAPPCPTIIVNLDPSVPPWDQVDWNALNECESNIGGKASTGFSHRLPQRPDQQYFEEIGKYLQYNAGWDDWGINGPAISEYLLGPSARFSEYRDMRGRANDFYNIASTAGYLLVANHILSALDAAFTAGRFNANLKMRAHLQPTIRDYGFVEFVPTATMTLTF